MSSGGLSKAGLDRLHEVMARHVEHGGVPGLVTLVSRRGDVHADAIGTKTADGDDPVGRDTIFRISSMTKPVTATATMILVEECVLRLDDPVDPWLPELADRRVLQRIDASLDDTVPAHRPITVRDLLTFRLGHGMVMAPPPDTYPIQDALAELGFAPGPPAPGREPEPDEWMRRLGTLPLVHQPGERWLYHTGAEVLGVLIARATGQSFDTFLRERIFDPLGMRDTGFSVAEPDIDRLATSYLGNPETHELQLFDEAAGGMWSRPPTFPSGGAGLVSTVDDFAAFAEMLLHHGRRGSVRVLSRPSVQAMTTDQLTPEQKANSEMVPGFWDTNGWGFGLSIVTARDDVSAVPGRFGWDGGLGTAWSADPTEQMVVVLMTQRAWDSPAPPPVVRDFRTSAYAAIDD